MMLAVWRFDARRRQRFSRPIPPDVRASLGVLERSRSSATKHLRQSRRANVVIRMQRDEAVNAGGDTHRGKSWMPRGRIRSTMIHGRTDRHARSASCHSTSVRLYNEAAAQCVVLSIVLPRGIGIDRSRKIAFQMAEEFHRLRRVARHHEQVKLGQMPPSAVHGDV